MERLKTTVSAEEFAAIKAEKKRQDMLKTPLPEGPELIVGCKYQLVSYNIVEVKSIDVKNDKLHIFDYTQNCNIYPKLSTFRVKCFV